MSVSKNPPHPSELRNMLRYDQGLGKLYWRARSVEHFTDGKRFVADQHMRRWNTIFAGKEAFRTLHKDGYLMGKVRYQLLLAHRVIWAVAYGEWPSDEIDHIDGDRANNLLSNLRIASRNDNMRNTGLRSNNRSGYPGVSLGKSGKWSVSIRHAKRRYYLGLFPNFDDAVAAKKAAEARFGFHQNHGRARTERKAHDDA